MARQVRVEQHRVVALDASGRPVGHEDDVNERIIHHLVTAQAQVGPSIGVVRQGDAQFGNSRVVFEARGLVIGGRRHTGLQARCLCGVDVRDVDFSAQRFAQRRLDREFAQRQRVRIDAGKAQRHGDGGSQGACLPAARPFRRFRNNTG